MLRKIASIVLIFSVSFTCSQSIDSVYNSCGLNINCAEEKLINLIDEYDTRPAVKILEGVFTIERNRKEISAAKNEDVLERVMRYISNHDLKINLPDNLGDNRSFASVARSSKLKKIILPVLLLLKLKAAILIPAILSAIALVAFKGLGAGVIALMLSAATAFKSALEGHASSKRVSLEVVPPHWSRAGVAPSGPAFVQEWPIHGYQTLP